MSDQKQPSLRILFVDDAPEVLQHLRRSLAPMTSEWDMHFYASGKEALSFLDSTECDAVVSDMTMPEMDGVKLLAEVRVRRPHAVRIVLSGDTSQYNHVRSSAVAHRFATKQAAIEDLKATIVRSCALRAWLNDESLLDVVNGVKTLPSLPSLYQELMQEMQSANASLKKAARIVGKDIGMVTKILQLVNSAFFGLRTHVTEPEQAVALLGFDTIKSLVLSMQVFSQFDQTKVPSFSLEDEWQHGLTTGAFARTITKSEGVEQTVLEESFTAALLHDVGTVILATNRPDDYTRVVTLMAEKHLADWQAEQEVFGATHAQVGAYLLGMWGLGDAIVEAVAYHHRPMDCLHTHFNALTAVHVSNSLAEGRRRSAGGTPVETHLDQAYLERGKWSERIPQWEQVCADR